MRASHRFHHAGEKQEAREIGVAAYLRASCVARDRQQRAALGSRKDGWPGEMEERERGGEAGERDGVVPLVSLRVGVE